MESFPFKRIVIVGATGSGKSTLAETLAQRFKLDFVELDALFWLPAWQQRSPDEFRTLVDEATRSPGWVVSGNYHSVRDLTWSRAEALIWLDYPFWTVFWRLWRRTWRRWYSRELLWGTNRESLRDQLMIWSPEKSLIRWLVKSWPERRREYPLLFALPENSHLEIIHLQSPRETEAWLRSLLLEHAVLQGR